MGGSAARRLSTCPATSAYRCANRDAAQHVLLARTQTPHATPCATAAYLLYLHWPALDTGAPEEKRALAAQAWPSFNGTLGAHFRVNSTQSCRAVSETLRVAQQLDASAPPSGAGTLCTSARPAVRRTKCICAP